VRALLAALLLLVPALAQDEDPIELAIPGTVVGERGEPLAGVRVEAWDALEPERFLGEGASGANGRFLLALRRTDLARREHAFAPVRLAVRGEGLATTAVEVEAGARDVRIAVAPARVIRGRVTDPDARPVPGAIVRGGLEETTADEEGLFVLKRSGAGRVRIEAYRDHVGIVGHAVAEGGADGVTVVLPRATPVPGRVAAVGSGEPIAGARVYWGDRVVAEADAAGVFAVAVDPAAPPPALFVAAPGYRVAAFDGETTLLAKAEPLRGRVADAGDRAVPGAVVTLAGDVTFVAVADGEGLVAFDAVPTGLVRLLARAPGYLEAAVRLDAGAGDEIGLRLSRGAAVAGRAVREGAPATGVRVSALDARGGESAFGYTDTQGRFLFAGVPAAATRLVAVDSSGASMGVPLGTIEEGGRGGPFLLEVKDHLPLSGTLRSDAGFPLAGVRVACGGREATTDREGRFSFDRLPAKPLRLAAAAERHFPLGVEARPGTEIDLVATSRFGEARLEVEVAGASLFTVDLAARAHPRVSRSASAAPVVFEGLAPGSYDVRVRAPGCLEFAQVVDVPPEGARIVAALARGGTLRLIATPGASVAIFAVRGKAPPVVALKLAEGGQTLSDFGPGLYRFVSRADGELVVVRELELGPTTPPRDLDLRGGKESTLLVDVRDATGAPVVGAEITLATESGFSRKVGGKTDANGQLRIDRLFDGRIYVRASLGDRVGETALDVQPGSTLSTTLPLR
jgi:hypothetical protein